MSESAYKINAYAIYDVSTVLQTKYIFVFVLWAIMFLDEQILSDADGVRGLITDDWQLRVSIPWTVRGIGVSKLTIFECTVLGNFRKYLILRCRCQYLLLIMRNFMRNINALAKMHVLLVIWMLWVTFKLVLRLYVLLNFLYEWISFLLENFNI